jgi:acetyltransferase-like isoleucine patch superfamily enzyme
VDVTATSALSVGARVKVHSQLQVSGPGGVMVGERCEFLQSNSILVADPTATVRIGNGCAINGLDVFATRDVTFGERCRVGSCSMMTTDFHSTHPDRWSRGAPVKSGSITVGANVWIANNTIITKGVSIGDNSVVSIGTVVRDDVPANVIVSSHHQRVVKQLPSTEV